LGASKWETTVKLYFNRISKIITGLILSIGRVSERRFYFTVAAYFLPKLPTSIFDQAMVLSFICDFDSGTDIENQERWLMVQHLY
jgi:phosphate transport system permease protein